MLLVIKPLLMPAGSTGQMTDEQLARQLQEQLDMEDAQPGRPNVHHPPGPSLQETQVSHGRQNDLQASLQGLFTYDNRADEEDGGGRFRGRGGRRPRSRGRGRRG